MAEVIAVVIRAIPQLAAEQQLPGWMGWIWLAWNKTGDGNVGLLGLLPQWRR